MASRAARGTPVDRLQARRRRVAAAVAFLAVAAGAILGVGRWWTRRVIPQLDGRTPVGGLHAAVDVHFDRFAVPHIYAASESDAWTAVGYLQGRDRLWQMDLYRRAASGRLSELLGTDTLAIDERFLTLGLRLAAEIEWTHAAPPARTALESYAAGVNAAIAAAGGWRRPLELQLLGVAPEPWTPIDSLTIGKLFAWRLGENHQAELLRYSLEREVGPRAAELFGAPPAWAPAILADGDRARSSGLPPRLADVNQARHVSTERQPSGYPAGLEWLSDEHHAASNSWVLSGGRTASGRPLLANDPHLAIEMPSVWWEVHVVAAGQPGLNVAGVTIPGLPFVVIGHNDRIAWGLTNSGADVQDFYVERLDGSRQRYLFDNGWLPIETARHDVRVSGRAAPVPFEVHRTRHGPILNAEDWREIFPADRGPLPLEENVLALKWDAVVSGGSADAFEALAHAANWTGFLAAVHRFSAPSQNFVYADVDGNIGYAMSGLLPVRRNGDGTMPTIGSMAGNEWMGTVTGDDLPSVLNPASGEIVTANNEIDRNSRFLITRDWVAPFRAQRITALLGARRGLDIAAMASIQADILSLSADSIITALGAAAPAELRQWDRRVDARPVSAFYEAFEEALWRRTFADDIPDGLYDRFYRYAANERFAGLHAVIGDPSSAWFDDRSTPDVRETRDDIARLAAKDALESMSARFGAEPSWRWDRMHAVTFSHPLAGGGRVLDWFFSRGPIPVAGDSMTVNKTTTNLRRPYGTSEAASYRQILDVGAWDLSLAVNTTGQSGHAASPHYFDQNSLWREGRYHSLPFSRAAVDGATASRLDLVPENEKLESGK
jgi:penicillin amidase